MRKHLRKQRDGTPSHHGRLALAVSVMALVIAGRAEAQLPVPASSQFDMTGFIQEATLGGPGTGAGTGALQGGTIKLNGHVITVPSNTIVILPANALTWKELFDNAPAPYTGLATGLAQADLPAPLGTYEAHVIGNRVLGGSGGADVYIAGMINISQQGLNSGAGFINFIDYTLGEMRVGGVINDTNCAQGGTPTSNPLCSGTRVRLNDPVGRYGRIMSPDPRFSVDDANPTIIAGTGFPMCFPRTNPASLNPDGSSAADPLCPEGNRTGQPATIQMNDPGALPGIFPDATKQAPFEVGDYITFAGTIVRDDSVNNPPQPTTGPWPGTANTYVSAHTITNNIAIYTYPGTNPAYVMVDTSLIGTGGLTVLGAGEAAIRTRFEGMTTDPTRNVHLYGIDLDPTTGATSDRDWGTIGVDPGAPTGAVKGRWRFRPPCTATTATAKACTPPPAGTFLPPTREMRAVIEGLQSQNPENVVNPTTGACGIPGFTTCAVTTANGIFYGQYHAPIAEYIFPENIPGSPIVENNFNSIDFLAKGGYASSTGVLAKVLDPWPSNVVPAPVCTSVAANAGGPYTVASNGTVTLAGSGTGSPTLTLAWAPPSTGSLSALNIGNPVYQAPAVATQTTVNLSLTVTQVCGGVTTSSTATTTVTINAAAAPTVAGVAPVSVFSGANGSIPLGASDPGGLKVSFAVTQTGTPALTNLVVGAVTCTTAIPSSCTATATFTAPILPIGQVTSALVNLTITATNTANVSSAPTFSTVTVKPLPDSVTITSTEYRTSKQRLVINASSSTVSTNVVLLLQPYQCQTVAGQVACPPSGTYDPDPANGGVGNVLTNNGNGTYIGTLVGAPPPACNGNGTFATPCPLLPLTVKSNLNGTSPPHGLDKIRQ